MASVPSAGTARRRIVRSIAAPGLVVGVRSGIGAFSLTARRKRIRLGSMNETCISNNEKRPVRRQPGARRRRRAIRIGCRRGTARSTPPTPATTAPTTTGSWPTSRSDRRTGCSTSGAGRGTSPVGSRCSSPTARSWASTRRRRCSKRRAASPGRTSASCERAEELRTALPNDTFDAIFSRATLQWIPLPTLLSARAPRRVPGRRRVAPR